MFINYAYQWVSLALAALWSARQKLMTHSVLEEAEQGQGVAEYIVIFVVIVIVLVVLLTILGPGISGGVHSEMTESL